MQVLNGLRSSRVFRSMTSQRAAAKMTAMATTAAIAAALSGCYVVPLDPKTGQPYPTHGAQVVQAPAPVVVVQPAGSNTAAAPVPAAYTVRLYPTNEQARAVGILQATVLDSNIPSPIRGSFTVNYGGQALQGEATRVDRNYPSFGGIMQSVQGGYNWAKRRGSAALPMQQAATSACAANTYLPAPHKARAHVWAATAQSFKCILGVEWPEAG